MSEVLYRKYRPENFKELVGQDQVKNILERAVENDNVAHAYIFSGSRGTGKTTSARILAKTLNCLSEGYKPCGECESCISIDKTNHMDVVELDAASYRGIEEIRKIRDAASYRPVMGKYKVYIIDEFHMLTREAFNALLKTLEEPPDKVVFILATTNLEKVPETVLSRCQIFNFKPLNEKEICDYLQRICEAEKIKCSNEGLKIIAFAAKGGMRDAVNLLERVITFHGDVEDESVKDTLGILPDEIISNYLSCLKKGDWSQMAELSGQIVEQGYSYEVLLDQALEKIKNLITSSSISMSEGAKLASVLWDISRELKYADNKRGTFEVLSIIKGSQITEKQSVVKSTPEISRVKKPEFIRNAEPVIEKEPDIREKPAFVEKPQITEKVPVVTDKPDKMRDFIDFLYEDDQIIPWTLVNLADVEEKEDKFSMSFRIEDRLAENLAREYIEKLSELFVSKLGKEVSLCDGENEANSEVMQRLSPGEREYVQRIMTLFGNGKNIDLEIEEEETHG